MAYVLIVLAVGLALTAWRAKGRVRAWLAVAALLNIGAALHMVASGYPYATTLRPAEAARWEPEARR